MFQRKNMRQKYNLKEEPANDCVVTLCCSPCALCQEAREMKSRGKLIAMDTCLLNALSDSIRHSTAYCFLRQR